MSAEIVDGRQVAAAIHEEVAAAVAEMRERGHGEPGIHAVLVGDNPASASYVRGKETLAGRLGVRFVLHRPPESVSTEELVDLVNELNADPGCDGILVQLPLPGQVDVDAVIDSVDPRKDADGFHPLNLGRLAAGRPVAAPPCTPAGCMELLRRYGCDPAGQRAVIVGRSTIVGRPLAIMLTNSDATVTLCHSRTTDLPAVCREADILVVAIGRAEMVDERFVKPGAFVVDVGTSRVDGRLTGDVKREAVEPVAGWLTPVPGGVGPLTVAMLMRNTCTLAREQRARGERAASAAGAARPLAR